MLTGSPGRGSVESALFIMTGTTACSPSGLCVNDEREVHPGNGVVGKLTCDEAGTLG
jgi:hypothetical protein